MQTNNKTLCPRRINRIREQGYLHHSDKEINDLAFGNRFAYRLCVAVLIGGVAFANIPTLIIMNLIALFGVILPNHPFDYIYNELLSKQMNKPKLSPRSPQLKFACSIATVWIAGTIYLFASQMMIAGYVMGAALILVAGLVASIDFCIPSIIYNTLFWKEDKTYKINN